MEMTHASRMVLLKEILARRPDPYMLEDENGMPRIMFTTHAARNAMYNVVQTTGGLVGWVSVLILKDHGDRPGLCLYVLTCGRCGELESAHGPNGKCLFAATAFLGRGDTMRHAQPTRRRRF